MTQAEEESIKSSEEEKWYEGLTGKVTPIAWSPGGVAGWHDDFKKEKEKLKKKMI